MADRLAARICFHVEQARRECLVDADFVLGALREVEGVTIVREPSSLVAPFRYRAAICGLDGIRELGTFDSAMEAVGARDSAEADCGRQMPSDVQNTSALERTVPDGMVANKPSCKRQRGEALQPSADETSAEQVRDAALTPPSLTRSWPAHDAASAAPLPSAPEPQRDDTGVVRLKSNFRLCPALPGLPDPRTMPVGDRSAGVQLYETGEQQQQQMQAVGQHGRGPQDLDPQKLAARSCENDELRNRHPVKV
jgi:hypothetical protein